jgi:RecA-family ATPase
VFERFANIIGAPANPASGNIAPVVFDFDQDPEPPAYLVDRLLERQTVNILSGDTGAGKSLVMAALVVAICTARGTWLGREVYADRVLVIDEENPSRVVRDRLRALGLRNEHAARLRYFNRQGFTIGTPEWTERLRTEAREHKADLVVIDTAAAATNAEVNDNDAVAALYRNALRPIATELDLAVVVLHHERKPQPGQNKRDPGQAMMGARQWAGQADSHIALRCHTPLAEESDVSGHRALRSEFVMSTPKIRDGEPDVPVVVAIESTKDRSGRLLSMRVTELGRLEVEPSKQQILTDAVTELLAERGEMRRADIEQALGSPSVGTLARALKLAMDAGLITSPRRGSYAPATPAAI